MNRIQTALIVGLLLLGVISAQANQMSTWTKCKRAAQHAKVLFAGMIAGDGIYFAQLNYLRSTLHKAYLKDITFSNVNEQSEFSKTLFGFFWEEDNITILLEPLAEYEKAFKSQETSLMTQHGLKIGDLLKEMPRMLILLTK